MKKLKIAPKEIDAMYDLREPLEVHAIRTATFPPRLLRDHRHSVECMREFLKANDSARYITEDAGFHAALASAAGIVTAHGKCGRVKTQSYLETQSSGLQSKSMAG